MISPNDIKAKAERKYFSFLQAVVQAIPFSRIVIPGDKTYNKASIADFHNDILALANQSKEKKGFGFTMSTPSIGSSGYRNASRLRRSMINNKETTAR